MTLIVCKSDEIIGLP